MLDRRDGGGVDWAVLLIPLISGLIGLATNYAGIRLLFHPVRFVGVRIPGLGAVGRLLPRRLQALPGVTTGGIGWQGVIPSRAAKMGSIAVDKGIAKLGSPSEFYEQLDPDAIAEHILATSGDEIHELVEQVMARERPRVWRDTPVAIRQAIHQRIDRKLPSIVHNVTDRIGQNIEQLLDIKLMVIRRIEAQPSLANRIFLEVGERELRFVVWSGLFLGGVLGLLTLPLLALVQGSAPLPPIWFLPLSGIVVGYLTNWIALTLIFEPIRPVKVGPVTLHGLFMRRQDEIAAEYSRVIADDVVTLAAIGHELVAGPRSDRTRALIEEALRPAIDEALGIARGAVRVAIGTRQYEAIRTRLASEAIDHTMTPLVDPRFNAQQSDRVFELLRGRLQELGPEDFAEMLRSAFQEDEWMLIMIGSLLGLLAGLLQYGVLYWSAG